MAQASLTFKAFSGVSVIVMAAESIIKPNRTKRWEGLNTDFFWVDCKPQGIELNKSVNHVRDTKIVCSPLEVKGRQYN